MSRTRRVVVLMSDEELHDLDVVCQFQRTTRSEFCRSAARGTMIAVANSFRTNLPGFAQASHPEMAAIADSADMPARHPLLNTSG